MPKHPSLPSVGRGNRPAQMLERAALALRMQHFGEAEQLAAEVLRTSRTDTAATMILARALIAQNRAGEAIAPLEKAARRSSDAGIETLLGAALGSAGRGAEAIEQLRRTAARRPPFLPAFQELAGQLAKAGRVEEAIAVAESASRIGARKHRSATGPCAPPPLPQRARQGARDPFEGSRSCAGAPRNPDGARLASCCWTANMPLPPTPTGMRWRCVPTMP